MQIVIDIPAKLACEGFERPFTEEEKNTLIKAIGNGKPLPKGHGRLIEVTNQLEQELFTFQRYTGIDEAPYESATIITDKAPTIIEADKAESEDKMSDIKTMPLICLRCKKYIPLSMPTFKEVSYTHYSYCEECLREGLKALKAWDELYKQIYDHHYEIIKSEPSESRNAKLSLSNWILDIMTGYDFEPQAESEAKNESI